MTVEDDPLVSGIDNQGEDLVDAMLMIKKENGNSIDKVDPTKRKFFAATAMKAVITLKDHNNVSRHGYSGVKPVDKREGGGAHNWGSHKDVIEYVSCQ